MRWPQPNRPTPAPRRADKQIVEYKLKRGAIRRPDACFSVGLSQPGCAVMLKGFSVSFTFVHGPGVGGTEIVLAGRHRTPRRLVVGAGPCVPRARGTQCTPQSPPHAGGHETRFAREGKAGRHWAPRRLVVGTGLCQQPPATLPKGEIMQICNSPPTTRQQPL